jgi:hypothetical protein
VTEKTSNADRNPIKQPTRTCQLNYRILLVLYGSEFFDRSSRRISISLELYLFFNSKKKLWLIIRWCTRKSNRSETRGKQNTRVNWNSNQRREMNRSEPVTRNTRVNWNSNQRGQGETKNKQSPETDLGGGWIAADEKSRTLLLHRVEWIEARSTAEEGTGHGQPEENESADGSLRSSLLPSPRQTGQTNSSWLSRAGGLR